MPIDSKCLPESFRKRMTPQSRIALRCPTNEESGAIAEAKSEKHLQGQIVSLLRRNGHEPYQQRMDKKSNVATGLPDIHFSIGGKAVYWEVKMPGKNPDPEQKVKINALASSPNNAHVRVIRFYEEALEDYRNLERRFLG